MTLNMGPLWNLWQGLLEDIIFPSPDEDIRTRGVHLATRCTQPLGTRGTNDLVQACAEAFGLQSR